ncbi:hypothetical protein CISIN_1g038575mg [Citrus sinensis]|uniref:Apple domain-containing protein n=1 Tax=Citrus sinensis TaxID=2711 RepID=A0A067DI35_CITSI|nr:hypothetical protein CISIN_1g038575mg [Citrus sinensis]
MQLSFAADTVTTATFICDGEKLVSSSQRFELGFSSPEVLADNEDEIYIRYDSINISSVVILKVNLAGPVTHLIWNVMFSAPGLANERINLKRSEADCLKNCTCRAYTDSKLTGGDSGCLMCFGDLIFVRRSLGNFTGQSVYIRVPASEPGNKLGEGGFGDVYKVKQSEM